GEKHPPDAPGEASHPSEGDHQHQYPHRQVADDTEPRPPVLVADEQRDTPGPRHRLPRGSNQQHHAGGVSHRSSQVKVRAASTTAPSAHTARVIQGHGPGDGAPVAWSKASTSGAAGSSRATAATDSGNRSSGMIT